MNLGGVNNPKLNLGDLEMLWEQPQELFPREIKPGISPHPEDADYPGKAQAEGRSSPESQLFQSRALDWKWRLQNAAGGKREIGLIGKGQLAQRGGFSEGAAWPGFTQRGSVGTRGSWEWEGKLPEKS